MKGWSKTHPHLVPQSFYTIQEQWAQAIEDGALFLVNHSGGKDSQCLYAVVTEMVPEDQIVVVHADLGDEVEWLGVKDHIRSSIHHPLILTKARYADGSDKGLLDMVEKRGKWPSAAQRYCTSDLKRGPIDRVIRHLSKALDAPMIVSCIGYRAQESPARAKRPLWTTNTRLSVAGRTVIEAAPIMSLTVDQVWALLEASGQRRHWAYDEGMGRLSCCFCVLSSNADLNTAARLNPGLRDTYVAVERRIGHTFRNGKSLADLTASVPSTEEEFDCFGLDDEDDLALTPA